MQCWHCGWRNPARLSECELCGKLLQASPRAAHPSEYRPRLDVVNRADERPTQRKVNHPLFQETTSLAVQLVQGQASASEVLNALQSFWQPIQGFLEGDLPAIVEASPAELGELAGQAETDLRRGVAELRTILLGWETRPQPAELAQRLLDIQNGLNVLGQCRDLDEEVTER